MSTSGTTSYSVTEREVIEAAGAKIGVIESGQTMDAADLVVFRRNLNMLVKQWVAQADFAPGLKMWTRRRAYLFLQAGQEEYTVGPGGDECAAETYVMTALAGDSNGASATLDSTTGIVAGMRIGFVQSSGTVWTSVATVAGLSIVTLVDAVTAPSGSKVYAYAAKPVKPFEIIGGSLRDTDLQDSPIDVNLSLDEYEQIPSKQSLGTPSRIYCETKKDGARLYLDRSPDDTTKVVRLVFYSYIEDSTAQTDDVDFPAEWYRALVGQLALDSALDFSRPVTPELKMFRDEALRMAQNAHPANSSAYYVPEPDFY